MASPMPGTSPINASRPKRILFGMRMAVSSRLASASIRAMRFARHGTWRVEGEARRAIRLHGHEIVSQPPNARWTVCGVAQIVNSRWEFAEFHGISQVSASCTSVLSTKASSMITISVANTPAVSNWLDALAQRSRPVRGDQLADDRADQRVGHRDSQAREHPGDRRGQHHLGQHVRLVGAHQIEDRLQLLADIAHAGEGVEEHQEEHHRRGSARSSSRCRSRSTARTAARARSWAGCRRRG